MLEYIREIDTEKWKEKPESNIKQYKKVPGVWILLGKQADQSDGSLMCLQTAKTIDIGGEIKRNISFLNSEAEIKPVPKKYVNQFGEAKFDYEEYPAVRARTLYRKIAQEYTDLIFVCAAHGEKLENKNLRETIEKYIAYRTLCPYWANGGPYKEGKDSEEEVRPIKEACKNECSTLFKKIKDDYPEGANRLKTFLDNLIARKIKY